jgi:histone-lysine N-methyltransferase SUV39H
VYLVVHDIPPDVGLPFIVFVAKEDVSAGTELTFDYNPREAERLKKKKRGRKKKNVSSSAGSVSVSVSVSENREGSRPCKCGSKSCRGFLL